MSKFLKLYILLYVSPSQWSATDQNNQLTKKTLNNQTSCFSPEDGSSVQTDDHWGPTDIKYMTEIITIIKTEVIAKANKWY